VLTDNANAPVFWVVKGGILPALIMNIVVRNLNMETLEQLRNTRFAKNFQLVLQVAKIAPSQTPQILIVRAAAFAFPHILKLVIYASRPTTIL
jgi:hypothetical protein